MRILVTGSSGFLGTRLARALLARGSVSLRGAPAAAIDELHLIDLAAPPDDLANDSRTRVLCGDLHTLLAAGELSLAAMDAVIHLSAAVSGECEADLDLGLRSNLLASLQLLQAARHGARRPLFVFASSVAVFGAVEGHAMPDTIEDHHLPTPRSSYGVQKYAVEQLVADFDRRGHVHGRNVRLMTVAVRPGRPNGAASSFLSGMIREPLAGQRATVPVSPDMRVALASPRRTMEGLMKALEASDAAWGSALGLNLPALSTTVGQIAATLQRVAGQDVAALLDWKRDARIEAVVGGWPARFESSRAARLGLEPDASVEPLIRDYAADHADALGRPLVVA